MSDPTPAEELKVRARVRLNRARREGKHYTRSLGDHLQAAAREIGFLHWDHARRVLGGTAAADEDMGDFWHAPRTGLLEKPLELPARLLELLVPLRDDLLRGRIVHRFISLRLDADNIDT